MTSSIFSQLILPISLFVIMFGMGLSLTTNDFKRVAVYPKAVLVGVVGQMLLLPAVGFLIAAVMLDQPALAVGLVLLAACPGGTTSNLITHQARGDLALSVTLTAIVSVVTIMTIPLITGIAMRVFADASTHVLLPVGQMMATLIVITLLPISLGMAVRRRFARTAKRIEPKISAFGALFLAVLIVIILYQQGSALKTQLTDAGPTVLLLNVTMMLVGYGLARKFGLTADQSVAITIEVGIQNATLAILIASTVLQDSAMAVPAAIYSLAMYLTGASLIIWRRRRLAAARRARTTMKT